MTTLQDIENFLSGVRQKGRPKVAFVSGAFTVLHPGHLRLLRFAKEQADVLVVGVHSDSLANNPLIQETERLLGVEALSYVDRAFVLKQPVAGSSAHSVRTWWSAVSGPRPPTSKKTSMRVGGGSLLLW